MAKVKRKHKHKKRITCFQILVFEIVLILGFLVITVSILYFLLIQVSNQRLQEQYEEIQLALDEQCPALEINVPDDGKYFGAPDFGWSHHELDVECYEAWEWHCSCAEDE